MKIAQALSLSVLLTLFGGVTVAAHADDAWQKNHPRREQVNQRLGKQNRRITQEVKGGEMSQGQAATLHAEHRQIRQEERTMASQNGGHITRLEQKTLNRQENAVSKQIGK